MENAQLVPWPDNTSEIIFACHTSMISPQIIVDEVAKHVDLTEYQKVM